MVLTRTQLMWLFLIVVGLIRLISLALYPLMDTTEARYGEIARMMVETGNWITPQIDHDTPFWGKPPLYAWISAVSILLMGNSEFALRLPHLFSAIFVLILIWQFAIYLKLAHLKATYAIAVTSTSIGFLIASGAVMTDMLLTLSMSMAMIGFWRSWHGDRVYNYLLYAGVGIGLLAKGPVIFALVILVLFPWLVFEYGPIKMWKQIWRRLNIISGLIFIFLICSPWYFLAEQATPGFLEYFIIGEHFHRFIDSGWQGDLYGAGHAMPRGTIWIYWFLLALPWSPFVIWGAIKFYCTKDFLAKEISSINIFLLMWIISPIILFTFAGNILPVYVLPGIPAIGLFILLNINFIHLKNANLVFIAGPLMLLIILSVIVISFGENESDKNLLKQGVDSTHPLYYFKKRPYSARYYSNGKAEVINATPEEKIYYLVIEKNKIESSIVNHCQLRSNNKKRALYICGRGNG